MKYTTFLTFLFLLLSLTSFSQEKILRPIQDRNTDIGPGGNRGDETGFEARKSVQDREDQPHISDYKIISVRGDTTFVDTTLTIRKEYKFNYLRKDNFGLLPFSNIGQTYSRLTPATGKLHVMPEFGARAAHFSVLDAEDVYYYRVPTPWSQLFFKTTFEQGQLLDAFFTSNISPQYNLSIAYKGLNSLGKYRHDRVSQGSFRTTLSHKNKSERYHLNTHFIWQELSADQNGGLTPLSNSQFQSGGEQFVDRAVLDVKHSDAERLLRVKRLFAKHYYNLIEGESDLNNQLQLGHTLNFTDKEYHYEQGTAFPLYGVPFKIDNILDQTEFQEISNALSAQYQNKLLGKLGVQVKHAHYNYGYKRKLYLDSGEIPNRIKGNIMAVGATYHNKIGGFELTGEAELNTTGDFDGNYLSATAAYTIDSLHTLQAGISTNSHRPDYNFMLYQSTYKNYNWHNNFSNVQTQRFHFELTAPDYADIEADYTRIHNYTYFGLKNNPDSASPADTLVAPYQFDGDVNYFRIKASREFNFGKFSLDNTLMYQKVLEGESVFRLSPFVVRNSFYYRDHWFDRNLYVQTGLTFNYFTSFKADAYDPVLAEFYVQNFEELKGFPRLDLFFNGRIRQTRLFLKVENLTTIFDGNGHYAAPYQPYRDWIIRFGLAWDFFL